MNHKAVRAVEIPGHAAATLDCIVDEIEQRLVKLRKIGDLSGPIIHLCVDVDRVLAFPGWFELLVPDALKIRRHRTGPAAGDEEIPSELEVQRLKRRISRTLL